MAAPTAAPTMPASLIGRVEKPLGPNFLMRSFVTP